MFEYGVAQQYPQVKLRISDGTGSSLGNRQAGMNYSKSSVGVCEGAHGVDAVRGQGGSAISCPRSEEWCEASSRAWHSVPCHDGKGAASGVPAVPWFDGKESWPTSRRGALSITPRHRFHCVGKKLCMGASIFGQTAMEWKAVSGGCIRIFLFSNRQEQIPRK